MSSEEIWLNGRPYSRESLKQGKDQLNFLADAMLDDRGEVPPWVEATRAAATAKLREADDE